MLLATPVPALLVARRLRRVPRRPLRPPASHELAEDFRCQLEALLLAAYRNADLDAARAGYADLIDDAEGCGALAAAAHLRAAQGEVFIFLAHPNAGRLVFGDKGSARTRHPGAGAGHAGDDRRTDVGERWSVDGVRAVLMVKLQRKYVHGPWSPKPVAELAPSSAVQSRNMRLVSTFRLATG